MVHHTGVRFGRTHWDVEERESAYMDAAVRWGVASARPLEYNYAVGQSGAIWEQAGPLVAAHCRRMNGASLGVLLLLDVDELASPSMIDAFQWLRQLLVYADHLVRDHQTVPHYEYRSTACPGEHLASSPGADWASPTGEGRRGVVLDPLTRWWDPDF